MLCGIILAAGASTRMGRFKPMLPIGNTTFIKLLIRRMREAGAETIVVVTGYRSEELSEHLSGEEVDCVRNDRFYCTHMFDSMKLGLRNLPADCGEVFVTPVDAVMAPASVYRSLLASNADLARPVFEGRGGHPVLIRRPLVEPLLLYRGPGGLRGAIRSLSDHVESIPAETDLIRCDADTPEDYRRILGQYDREINEEGRVHIEFDISLTTGDTLFTSRFFQLMELTDMLGSLRNAANVLHLPYEEALMMVKHTEEHISKPFVSFKEEGTEGGGSELTEAGRDFLDRYKQLKRELDMASNEMFKKYFDGMRL